VFVDSSGKLSSQQSAVKQAKTNVSRLPHVLSVSDPLSQASVSKDGHTAYATVNFDTNPQSLGTSYVDSVDKAVSVATKAGVKVTYGRPVHQPATTV
jgi:putative drug exporter of the RND superfamily